MRRLRYSRIEGASGESVIATPNTRPDRATRGKDLMSIDEKLLSEKLRTLNAARDYKENADLVWLALLKPYLNTLAQLSQSARTFVMFVIDEHKCGVAHFYFSTNFSTLATLEDGAGNETFLYFETQVIENAAQFFSAARATFFALQNHFKENPELYVRMPDARNQLGEIIRLIDEKLAHAEELRQIPVDRFTAFFETTEETKRDDGAQAEIDPEAVALERDKRIFEATGRVTTRLLCDIHDVERGALGRFLRKLHHPQGAISTSEPHRFTPADRAEVEKRLKAGEVTKRQKRPEK